MPLIFISGGDLVLPDRVLEKSSLTIGDGRIAAVGAPPPPGADVINASGKYVLPGLIDVHAHGRMISLDPLSIRDNLVQDCMDFAATGVTRFLPALASAPVAAWLASMPALTDAINHPLVGAVPMGVHYEGIFLNPEAGGAHPGPLIKAFDADDADHRALFERWPGVVKMITFAPEVGGNEKLIEICRAKGIVMSLGHSAAGPEEVARFAAQGVLHMTHLFNGMKGLNHRDPGPPLAGLLDDRISVDFICDGYHLHPEVVRLIHRMKPRDQRILITDSVVIQMPGAEAGKVDEPNRLPGGVFAGSRLRLHSAVRNYMRFTGCPLPEAVSMASLNPATLLGMQKTLGSLEPGKIADLWIADRDLEPEAVFVGGERIK
ncbi:MAG TPA: amidohydrolase family protein [bacterium]|nr:amidohydrolase family protein [bacterium]